MTKTERQKKIDLLITCGEALYGSRWQTELASSIGYDVRRIRQWVTGDRPIPDEVWAKMTNLIAHKKSLLRTVESDLKKLPYQCEIISHSQ